MRENELYVLFAIDLAPEKLADEDFFVNKDIVVSPKIVCSLFKRVKRVPVTLDKEGRAM